MGQSETSDAGITPRQELALEALLSGATVQQAADAAGVDRRTITRWKSDPAFRSALRVAEREARARVSMRLMDLGSTALDTLAAAMSDASPIAVRARAAHYTLGRLLQLWQRKGYAKSNLSAADILAALDSPGADRGRGER
jgi:hypothetical protein